MNSSRFQHKVLLALWLAAGSGCLWLSGCSQPSAPAPKASLAEPSASSSQETVREDLRKPFIEPDQVRSALDQLSAVRDKPAAIDAELGNALKARFNLTEADLKEINRPEYGTIDAHLVYQGLFFADAARTLEVGKASTTDKAKAALAWVNRHVRLDQRDGQPDPPAMVAQRGFGLAQERTYVMAALTQAMGLQTWLVGDAEAAGNPAKIWGVAVVDGNEVAMFDARLGIPLPGTWRQLQQDATPLLVLTDLGYDVTADRVKASKFYLPMALQALAPRMKAVEALAPAGTDVAIDPKQLIESATNLPLAGWDAKSRGTPPRLLSEFLPVDEGGVDRPLPGQPSRVGLYVLSLLPWDAFPRGLDQIPGPLGSRLRQSFVAVAGCDRQQGIAARMKRKAALDDAVRAQTSQEKETPSDPRLQNDIVQALSRGLRVASGDDQGPTLRQLMLRGHFSEATEATAALTSMLTALRNRNGTAMAPAMEAWAQRVQAAAVAIEQARRSGDAQRLATAERAMAELGSGLPQADAFIQWLAAGPALEKLAFLTAVIKHDQAAANARHNKSPDVWKTPIALWNTYAKTHAGSSSAFHAQWLLAEALAASGQKDAAAAAYKKAGELTSLPFNKIACSYLASGQKAD